MKPSKRNLRAPHWSRRNIIAAAGRLLTAYENQVGRDHIINNGLHFDDFYEKILYPRFKTELYEDEDLGVDESGRKILGLYCPRDNVAYLDKCISRDSDDPRRIFTCWHEVAGHGALHGPWLCEQVEKESRYEKISVTDYDLTASVERQLEWQANLLASRLAAPDWLVNYAINTKFRPKRKFVFFHPCIYWLNPGEAAWRKYITDAGDLCGWIASHITEYFGGLSAQAIGYRVRDLAWVLDKSNHNLRLDWSERGTERFESVFANLSEIEFSL